MRRRPSDISRTDGIREIWKNGLRVIRCIFRIGNLHFSSFDSNIIIGGWIIKRSIYENHVETVTCRRNRCCPFLIQAEPITLAQAPVSKDGPKDVLGKKVTADKQKNPVHKKPQSDQQQVVPEQSKPTIVSNNTCNPTCICNCYPPKLYAEPITQTQAYVGSKGPKDVS